MQSIAFCLILLTLLFSSCQRNRQGEAAVQSAQIVESVQAVAADPTLKNPFLPEYEEEIDTNFLKQELFRYIGRFVAVSYEVVSFESMTPPTFEIEAGEVTIGFGKNAQILTKNHVHTAEIVITMSEERFANR